MSCPTKEKLEIINEDDIENDIKKIRELIEEDEEDIFPYFITCEFNRTIDNKERDHAKNMGINKILNYAKKEKLDYGCSYYSIDEFITVELSEMYGNKCVYVVDLIDLKVINKDEIKDKIKEIENELERKDYSNFPHYIICKLNRPWTKDEEYEVDNVCINTITDYITLDILKNDDLIKIEPSDQLDINEDEYEYRIELTYEFKQEFIGD